MTDETLRGRLLVASPVLGDPNFDRTVVLMLEHSDEGALGVILNRASTIELGSTVAPWASRAAPPAVLFLGGPVEPGAVIALGRGRGPETPGWKPLFGDLGTADLALPPKEVPAIEQVRVFMGYSGWAAGQLEGELAAGAWFVVDRRPGDPFVDGPDDLWRAVLRRQRGNLAMVSTYPPDPDWN